ncbi:MAG: bacterial Ig-like protein, partial [Paenibacillus sp.]|nr:bacterial Ig-like protein [Paenibacillus sp.]
NLDKGSELYLEYWDQANKRITPVSTKTNAVLNAWQPIKIQQQAPPNAVTATLLLYMSSKNTGTAYFDNATFGIAPPTPPVLAVYDHLVVNTSKTLYQIGDTGSITWYGTMSDGTLLDRSTVTHVTYESMAPGVISMNASTGSFQVLASGSTEIKVKVTADGITNTSIITLRSDDFSGAITSSKTKSTYYTDAKKDNIQDNIDEYGWARAQRDSAISNAAPYLALDDDQLWSIVTTQSVSRSLGIATRYNLRQKPSPDPADSTITNYGNYPWKIDVINQPWKLQSPVTGRYFPTNDFAAFYESGIDEYGAFNYELALQNGSQYLTNLEDPSSTWGIDDGWGWSEDSDDIWTFIAYYNHWGIWYNGFIMNALNSLRDAYLFTGNAEYAYKGLILLDRVADVYPDLDVTNYPWAKGFDNGDPGIHTGQGKAVNDIWETTLAKSLIFAYDAFFPEMVSLENRLVTFLSDKADTYNMANPKNSVSAIRKNIEDNIVRLVYPGMQGSQIRGNMGMHQSALALAAVVLDEEDTSKEWLDYVFQTGGLIKVSDADRPYGREFQVIGGDLNRLLVDDVDRDGMGNEAAPGYNAIWLDTFLETAEILDGYERYPEFDMYQNVKFQKMFSAFYQLAMLGKYTPSIGDSGMLGSPGVVGNINHDILAFERWGNPLQAQLIYLKNGNTASGLHSNIFSADPEQISSDIAAIILNQGPLQLDSTMMTGFGLAALRDGKAAFETSGTIYDFKDMKIVSANRSTKYLPAYSALLFQNTDGAGAAITFEFDVAVQNVYDIDLLPNKAASYGKYKYSIDGEEIGSYDFYGGSAPSNYSTLATRLLEAGPHTLTFEYEGQTPGATGYFAAFKKLALVSEEERELQENAEPDTQRDLWMYFGRNGGHGHKDTLNLGLHAYGMDLAPDLGYPDVTGSDPKRVEWTENTVAHNTVVVNKSKQGESIVGIPKHFDGSGNVKLFDVEAPHAYSAADLYRRTTSLIKVDNEHSYAVDFFRVEGGSNHTFSFHGADATITTEGLQVVPQKDGNGNYVGTYAGPSVAYGQKEPGSGSGSSYKGSGFHYLFDVDRAAAPQGPFSIDWKVKDTWGIHPEDPNVHLRLTMLNSVDEVALASGQPPQMNAKSPDSVRYMLAQRNGENLKSTFTSVIEPYRDERYIESIERVSVKDGQTVMTDETVQAVKVQLVNGRTDYIVYSLNSETVYTVDDRLQFQGFFGVYSEKNGQYESAYLNDGTLIGLLNAPAIDEEFGSLNGTVVDFTQEMSLQNEIVVNLDLRGLQKESLVGRMIYVDNDEIRNGAYEIKGVTSVSEQVYRLDLGNITLIRSYLNANDFSQGYVYDIAPAAAFRIPLSYSDVYEAPVITALTLSGAVSPGQAGTTQQTVVTATYSNNTTVDVTASVLYSSSDLNVAEVSPTGLITLKQSGTTVIKATYGEMETAAFHLQVVEQSASKSTAKPGKPVLADDNGYGNGILDGNYGVTMNMWHGENGSLYKLYENDVLIDTQIIADVTPAAQTAVTPISGKLNGTYRYYAELINAYGTTTSDTHVVTVTRAAPDKPVISHDNWDGDGSYLVSMNLWWGTNGATYRLYENGVLIDTRTLSEQTPSSQTAVTTIVNRGLGTYVYRAELVNYAGATSSETMTVTVSR